MPLSEITFTPEISTAATSLSANPVETLRQVAQEQKSGCLRFLSNGVSWDIYLHNQKLVYASSSFQAWPTLDYHFRCVSLNNFKAAKQSLGQSGLATQSQNWLQLGPHNSAIKWFHEQGFLNDLQRRQLLENLTKEAIESFLWLTEAHFQWIKETPVPMNEATIEFSLDLEDTLQVFQQRMQAWQQMGMLIKSPHQRPYLFAQNAENEESTELRKLGKLLRGMSIRQIALLINQDELKVAKLLYPYIQRGNIYLRNPQSPYLDLPTIPQLPSQSAQAKPLIKTFKVACVDDSPTILDEIHRFLDHDEYEVTRIENPVKAATILFRLKPDLILMDITMPEINGYKLCSLLRNSVTLRETPIIMVTGRSGLIDKARAKMTGATDYLVKPFTRGGLLNVVEKYLK